MSTSRTIAFGVVAGIAATVAKGWAEQVLQPLSERLAPPTPAQKTEIGADPAGHPENMPPSEIADRAVHALTGDELSDEQRERVSVPLHWSMGLGFAAAYALAARRVPAVRAGRGLLAGAGLFAATHGSTLPALGAQHPPWQLPTAWWGWEGGSHLVYGAVLDATLSAVEGVDRRLER